MNENVENLIIAQLREIRTDISAMKADISGIKGEMTGSFSEINQKVDGLTLMLGLLSGHVYHIEQRVEKLEGNRP